MLRPRPVALVRPAMAGLLLATTALLVVAAVVPHAHSAGQTDDCAVCKATHTVVMLRPVAQVRPVPGGVSPAPSPTATAARCAPRIDACAPRAPPAL